MKMETKSRILIVDDVPTNIKILLSILSDDYQLFVATSGQKALDVVATKPIDLILLDILMPEMNGFDVCRRLKENETTREIPIIFITGVCDSESEKMGLDLGALDYVSKPFSPAVVKARVKNHLTLQSSLNQLKRQNQALQEAEELRKQVEGITRHDMKSPLNGIIGFSDFLLEAKDIPARHLECLRIIRQEGFRALHMVNLSLGLLKMEQGTFTLAPVEVDLVPVLYNIFADLENIIQPKQLEIKVFLDAHPVNKGEKFIIWGEELLCFSVFSNLVKNAAEASPYLGIITVNLRQEDSIGVIEVRNQGSVPEQIRDRFFERYVTFGKNAGTGLGTYSARLITEAQGGTISLQPTGVDETAIVVHLPRTPSH